MIVVVSRTAAAAAVLAFILGGCSTEAPFANPTRPAAVPTSMRSGMPVPVLDVGDPVAVDLFGDGQATITVVATEVSTRPMPGELPGSQDTVQLVVTVSIVLDKAGNPITGGPENFYFRDTQQGMHRARTDQSVFPPEFAPVNLSAAGQQAAGKLFFDVPAELVDGGLIQLTTGKLVHAVWEV